MYLTKEEERLLSGEEGPAVARAMEVLVKVGEAMGAERLVPIKHAHVSGVSIFNIGSYGLEFLESMLSLGARVRVFTTANPASMLINHRYSRHALAEAQQRVVRALISMGVDSRSFTCLPYRVRAPKRGEHLGWAESSAVIVANSVFGAKTNREGGPIALMEAIAGYAPAYGMHIDENRAPTEVIRVRVEAHSIIDWSLIGLKIGEVTKGIPAIVFDSSRPRSLLDIKNLLASIASTSDSPMAFLEGITPERIDYESIGLERIEIDHVEIKQCAESIDALVMGCPHLEEDEVNGMLLRLLAMHSISFNKVIIAVPTDFKLSRVKEVLSRLRQRGIEIEIVFGACPVVTKLSELGLESVGTPHGKALHYLPRLAGVRVCPVRL